MIARMHGTRTSPIYSNVLLSHMPAGVVQTIAAHEHFFLSLLYYKYYLITVNITLF